MDKCDKLILKILDTMIELNDYSDVEDVAKWLHCGTEKHLSVDELRMLKADVEKNGIGSKRTVYTVKHLKKKLSDQRFMLRLGKAVHRCEELHEFGIDIPFRFFVLPDYIRGQIHLCIKKLRGVTNSEDKQA